MPVLRIFTRVEAAVIEIKSKDNTKFKLWMSLRQNAQGTDQEQVLIDGLRFCRDVLLSGLQPDQAIVSEAASQQPAVRRLLGMLPRQTERYRLSDRLMQRLSPTQQPQGVMLVVPAPMMEPPQLPPDPQGLFLIADQIQDPGNLGSMIRTADAFGFAALLITAGTVSALNDKVLRASMGSVFHIPLYRFADLTAAAQWLHHSHIPILAADLAGDSSLDGRWTPPAALLIGNEARGLTDQARSMADRLIHVPMPGHAESLNAAAAAAVLCYEMMRGREKTEPRQEEQL